MHVAKSLSLSSACRVRPCVLIWIAVLLCATIAHAEKEIEYTTGTVQSYFAVYLRFDTENLGCTEERLVENFANEEDPRVSTQLQAIRLLVWTRMRQPEYRKKMFLHWLALQDSPPEESIVIEHARQRLQSIESSELQQRIAEIKDAYTQRAEARERLLSHHLVVYTGEVDSTIDYLPDSTEPLGVRFFTLDHQRLVDFYTNLPLPRPYYEDGDYVTDSIYLILWLFEPNCYLRERVLLRRFADDQLVMHNPDSYLGWARSAQQYVITLNAQQRQERQEALNKLVERVRPVIAYQNWLEFQEAARREREWKIMQDRQQRVCQ